MDAPKKRKLVMIGIRNKGEWGFRLKISPPEREEELIRLFKNCDDDPIVNITPK